MKHIKLFEDRDYLASDFEIDLPEGYLFLLFNPNDKEDCKRHFDEGATEDWSEMSFEEWMRTLDQMGQINYPSGKSYYRGLIEWKEMGLSYIYEIHPL